MLRSRRRSGRTAADGVALAVRPDKGGSFCHLTSRRQIVTDGGDRRTGQPLAGRCSLLPAGLDLVEERCQQPDALPLETVVRLKPAIRVEEAVVRTHEDLPMLLAKSSGHVPNDESVDYDGGLRDEGDLAFLTGHGH